MAKLSFLAVKGVPTLFWSSPRPHNMRPRVQTTVILVVGLVFFGLAESLIIAASAGVSPWIVLAQGLSNITGWNVGTSTFVISGGVLATWMPLRQRPGIGTVLNAIIISFVIGVSVPYLPAPETYAGKILQVFGGIYLTGFGAALYLICNLGPGPRDGLMTGLQRVTGLPIAWVRAAIEITVVVAGWSLGGEVGIGTLMYALLIGPAVAINMYVLVRIFDRPQLMNETP